MLPSMHGDFMIDKDCAKDVQKHALNAIAELTQALTASENKCSTDEYEAIKTGCRALDRQNRDGLA